MINKHLRRCSTPLVTMKMLIKTSIQCKLKHIYVLLNHRMAKIKKKNSGNSRDGKDEKKSTYSYTADGNVKYYNTLEKSLVF